MPAPAPAPGPLSRPRVALVLGAGSVKAIAAVPFLRFLEDHGIRPDLLVGCSGGGVVLACWACGNSHPDRVRMTETLNPSLFKLDWRSLAVMLGLRRGFSPALSLFKTGPVMALYRAWFQDRRLETLPIPLVLQATDFETGEGVEMAAGDLAEAIYASAAAYPFFHPIRREGRLLFDGAFTAPVPVLAAIRRGMDVVLAVDFTEDVTGRPRNLFEAVNHMHKVLGRAVSQSQMLASIDLYPCETLSIKVRFKEDIRFEDTAATARILAAGEAAVEEYGAEILALCQAPVRPETSRAS